MSDLSLSHTRQTTWNVAKDALRESERIGMNELQILAQETRTGCAMQFWYLFANFTE
jgi:hypothetical protein